MINLYKREEVNIIKDIRKKHILISISIFIFAIIVFTLFLVFTNRENKIYHMVSNAIITSIIISIGYAYLSFKVLPINKELNKIDNNYSCELLTSILEIKFNWKKLYRCSLYC